VSKAMPEHWISVDPGTILTGVTLWSGVTPLRHSLVKNSEKDLVSQRIANVLAHLEAVWERHGVTLVVERPFARGRPNAAIDTLYRDIKAWAKQRKLAFQPYYHTTVKAALRRAFPALKALDGKTLLTAAVLAKLPITVVDLLEQDEIDSVAIGLAHLYPMPQKVVKQPRRRAA